MGVEAISSFPCVLSRNVFEGVVSLGGYVRCNPISSQVYTVGPDYAHAEARKSPALDGKVERDSEGKEIRYPVMLTAMEKLVARKVCVAFKVCVPGSVGWLCVSQPGCASPACLPNHQVLTNPMSCVSSCSKLCVGLTSCGQMATLLFVM